MEAARLNKQGRCAACSTGRLAHGPWTDEQIAEACADIGMPISDFGGWCDQCFVLMVAGGDAKYAEQLAGRPMQFAGRSL